MLLITVAINGLIGCVNVTDTFIRYGCVNVTLLLDRNSIEIQLWLSWIVPIGSSPVFHVTSWVRLPVVK